LEGASVRGFFGDGLKEGVLGLKRGGSLKTIKDGVMSWAELNWKDGTPVYLLRQSGKRASDAIRRQLGLRGNGTRLEIRVHPDVRVPRHESLYEAISRHFSLRDILQNPARTVVLRRLNDRGRVLQEDTVSHRDPARDEAFEPITIEGLIPGYPGAKYTLTVFRATEPLSGSEAGAQREGGIVVQAHRAIVDIGFFGHENRPGTQYLFGRLRCDALYDRLRAGDVVVAKNRSGLNRQNDFVKALLKELASGLDPIVAAEAKRMEEAESQRVDPRSKQRLEELRRELNKIAQEELDEEGQETGDEEGTPDFRFSGRGYTLYRDEDRVIRAYLRQGAIDSPCVVCFSVVGDGLEVAPVQVTVEADEAVEGFVAIEAKLVGHDILDAGLVEAEVGTHKASATVSVRERDKVALLPFAFERQSYRIPISEWKEVRLRIHVPSAPLLPAQVTFDLDHDNLQLRPSTEIADSKDARDDWLTLRVQVRGDQIGSSDVLQAKLGSLVATCELRVVSTPEHDPDKRRGLIKDIKFDPRPNPPQRTYFSDGVITIFVNHPSLKRYLLKPADQARPASRVLTADLVMHAFCRHVAERTYLDNPFVHDSESAVQTVFQIYEQMLRKYGERIHLIMNPR